VNTDAAPSSSAVTVVDYATTKAVRPLSVATVLITWLAPVLVEAIGWLIIFRPYAGDGVEVYSRNMIACTAGIPLSVGSLLRLAPVNSLPAYSLIASISWVILISVITCRSARSVPLIAHVLLSIFWAFGGCFAYLAMCY
jgi:hypothetical protein